MFKCVRKFNVCYFTGTEFLCFGLALFFSNIVSIKKMYWVADFQNLPKKRPFRSFWITKFQNTILPPANQILKKNMNLNFKETSIHNSNSVDYLSGCIVFLLFFPFCACSFRLKFIEKALFLFFIDEIWIIFQS